MLKINENQKPKFDLKDIPNYGELTNNDKVALKIFIDFISVLDESDEEGE